MKKFKNLFRCMLVISFLVSGVIFPFSAGAEPQGKLIIFHAGSLTVPLAKMEKIFEAKYPKVDILREGGGSTKMARMISELNKPADIMGSAEQIIPNQRPISLFVNMAVFASINFPKARILAPATHSKETNPIFHIFRVLLAQDHHHHILK